MEYAAEYFTGDMFRSDMGSRLLMFMRVLYHNLMAVSIARWPSGRGRLVVVRSRSCGLVVGRSRSCRKIVVVCSRSCR